MESAFLVAAELPAGRGAGRAARAPWGAAESLEELAQLARTAGIGVAGRLARSIRTPTWAWCRRMGPEAGAGAGPDSTTASPAQARTSSGSRAIGLLRWTAFIDPG
jgi:hypothetical protein